MPFNLPFNHSQASGRSGTLALFPPSCLLIFLMSSPSYLHHYINSALNNIANKLLLANFQLAFSYQKLPICYFLIEIFQLH